MLWFCHSGFTFTEKWIHAVMLLDGHIGFFCFLNSRWQQMYMKIRVYSSAPCADGLFHFCTISTTKNSHFIYPTIILITSKHQLVIQQLGVFDIFLSFSVSCIFGSSQTSLNWWKRQRMCRLTWRRCGCPCRHS